MKEDYINVLMIKPMEHPKQVVIPNNITTDMAIIKCPDCSSTFSSQVYTCPNCGRRIKGYVRQCPKCEEWVSADNPVCPLCENVVDNSAIAKEIKDDKDLSFTSHRQPRKRKSGSACCMR